MPWLSFGLVRGKPEPPPRTFVPRSFISYAAGETRTLTTVRSYGPEPYVSTSSTTAAKNFCGHDGCWRVSRGKSYADTCLPACPVPSRHGTGAGFHHRGEAELFIGFHWREANGVGVNLPVPPPGLAGNGKSWEGKVPPRGPSGCFEKDGRVNLPITRLLAARRHPRPDRNCPNALYPVFTASASRWRRTTGGG